MPKLIFKSIDKPGRYFPDWLKEYNDRSGAYVIRSKSSKEILYIGESHTGRLAATLKRHFWNWDDEIERQHFTFDPNSVEVALYPTTQRAAKAIQDELIEHYMPRYNKQGIPADEKEHREPVIPGGVF